MSVAAAILPFVFIGKHDNDEQVRDLFDKTWKDNVGGSRAVALYLQEIARLVAEHLESPRWVIKHASALAVTELVTSFEGEISVQDGEVLWRVLEKALAGKSWEGKEEVLRAFVRFTRNSRQLWGGARMEIGNEMKVGWSFPFFLSPSFFFLLFSSLGADLPRRSGDPCDFGRRCGTKANTRPDEF
jgi:proteasome component ECM29